MNSRLIKKYLMAIVLMLVVVITTAVPALAATNVLPVGSTEDNIQTAINAAASGDIIQVSEDINFTKTITIPENLNITIQSTTGNGWTLSQNSGDVRHFLVNGNLTLENIILDGKTTGGGIQIAATGSATVGTGAVITNCHKDVGGAIESQGTLTLNGGAIRNNTATNGGGVYVGNTGTVNIITGTISNNRSQAYGGGIYNGGTVNMQGGSITGNQTGIDSQYTTLGGGAIMSFGPVNISGGTISNNTAVNNNGGAIFLYSDATVEARLNVSGAVSFVENSAPNGSGGAISTPNQSYSNIVTGNQTIFRGNSASAAYYPPANAATQYPNIGFANTSITTHPLNNYDINYIGDPINFVNISYNANGGTGSHIGANIVPGNTDRVLSINAAEISRPGYTFVGWNTAADGSGTSYAPGDVITLNENITLYAQWEEQKDDNNYFLLILLIALIIITIVLLLCSCNKPKKDKCSNKCKGECPNKCSSGCSDKCQNKCK